MKGSVRVLFGDRRCFESREKRIRLPTLGSDQPHSVLPETQRPKCPKNAPFRYRSNPGPRQTILWASERSKIRPKIKVSEPAILDGYWHRGRRSPRPWRRTVKRVFNSESGTIICDVYTHKERCFRDLDAIIEAISNPRDRS